GIWHNNEKTFLVWVNEEDHCRVISMQQGGSLKGTFERFCRGLNEVEGLIKKRGSAFCWSQRFCCLCTCPSNLCTVLACSVHFQLHKFYKGHR
ncbi:hypothetical protein GH890_30800, partial [Bacillus thuringiensis]|nr:hypothetical protein [Bacillus thuringiensis]